MRVLVRFALGVFALAGAAWVCGCSTVAVSAQTESASGPGLQGKTFCVQGASISAWYDDAWQKVVERRTGMALGAENARGGRTFAQAFEVYGTTTPGSALKVNQGSVATSTGQFHAGTAGNTLAQDIAGCEVMFIELGTNDQGIAIGNLGDAVNAGTFFGNVRWVDETYLAANPMLRIVHISPQYNRLAPPSTTVQYVNALIAYGSSVGIPVINMFALGGVNDKSAPALTRDGTHPSEYGFSHFYGPVIAQGISQVY